MNCEQAKQLNLVQYLEYLNIHPKRICRDDYYYLSPLRDENNPSFHVENLNNIWYDHGGEGCGGTIIDFGIRYHQCSISDFLAKLTEYVHFQKLPNIIRVTTDMPQGDQAKKKKIIIHSTGPIVSPPLLYYLEYRKIPIDIAKVYCCEVTYKLYDRFYYAIGFKNDIGGYELRNKFFKGSSMPKGITFINRGFLRVEVFEGFFSFLSFLTVINGWEQFESNFLVLNSLSFFGKSQELMEKHDFSNLHLDRDKAGFKKAIEALTTSRKYRDASVAYIGYKDWNHYLLNKKLTA